MKPRCTIVIPCYNQADYLQGCLESLLAQTVGEWEAVVVDDASTIGDASEIVKRLADPRISFIYCKENRGLAASRNTGFRTAKSDFVLPLDADDRINSQFLERLLPLLENSLKIDCAFSDLQSFGAENLIYRYSVKDISWLLVEQWLPGAGTLMRKTLWEKAGGYCEEDIFRMGNEDWDFWLSAAEASFKPVHVPEPLYLYNRHSGSLSMHLRSCDYLTREAMYTRHLSLFGAYGAGGDFLAAGYLASGWANLNQKDYRAAFQAIGAIFRPVYRKVDIRFLALYLIPALIRWIVKKAVKKLNML